jgi:hypothetical protein
VKKKDKFLILEIAPNGVNALFLAVGENRAIELERFSENVDLKKFLKSPVRRMTQKSWEGEYLFKKSRRKVVVTAHPALATTIPIPLELPREHAEAKFEITLAELENLIAQAMGKIFNQCRNEAAKRLGIHELDTILVGAQARHFKIDGKSVINPTGFTGKKISLALELRFTTRELFEDLKQFFNAPDNFFFVEGPQSRLMGIARARKLPINLIVSENGGAAVYILAEGKEGYPVLYREKLGWDFDELINRIATELGVNFATAEKLYEHYRKGTMSATAARSFKRILDPALERFFEALAKEKLRGSVYIDAAHELPLTLPHRTQGATLEAMPLGEVLEELDFPGAIAPGGIPERILGRHLLPFLEAYFDKSNSEINQKLRRRLHWLLN